jgi:chemotaxis protein CheC
MITQSLVLSDLQKDALKEVGNIGAGHAATSLSQLLNTTIKLSEPSIDVIKFRELSTRVGYENRLVAAMHMYVRGEAPGQMIVLFDREHALDYVNSFVRRVIGDIRIFDSIVDSTLKVLGNIMAGAYLTALDSLTGVNLVPSVPTLSYGTVQAAFRSLLSILPDADWTRNATSPDASSSSRKPARCTPFSPPSAWIDADRRWFRRARSGLTKN